MHSTSKDRSALVLCRFLLAAIFTVGFLATFGVLVPQVAEASAASDVLRPGDSGAAVGRAQTHLNRHGYKVTVDRDYGPKTTRAVKAFQGDYGLDVDGTIGPSTKKALEGPVKEDNKGTEKTPAKPSVSIGTSRIVGNDDYCLDLPYGRTSNGTDLWLWSCNKGKGQQWTFHSNGEIRVKGRCLDVEGGSGTDGTNAQIWQCNGSKNQLWDLTFGGEIRSKRTGDCLDIRGDRGGKKVAVQMRTCDGALDQTWAYSNLDNTRMDCSQSPFVSQFAVQFKHIGVAVEIVTRVPAQDLLEDQWEVLWNDSMDCLADGSPALAQAFSPSLSHSYAGRSVRNQLKCHIKFEEFTDLSYNLESWGRLENDNNWIWSNCGNRSKKPRSGKVKG